MQVPPHCNWLKPCSYSLSTPPRNPLQHAGDERHRFLGHHRHDSAGLLVRGQCCPGCAAATGGLWLNAAHGMHAGITTPAWQGDASRQCPRGVYGSAICRALALHSYLHALSLAHRPPRSLPSSPPPSCSFQVGVLPHLQVHQAKAHPVRLRAPAPPAPRRPALWPAQHPPASCRRAPALRRHACSEFQPLLGMSPQTPPVLSGMRRLRFRTRR